MMRTPKRSGRGRTNIAQKIVDFGGAPIQACASFNFNGYCISFSNHMNRHYYEVMVFDSTGRGTPFISVEDAIEFCR